MEQGGTSATDAGAARIERLDADELPSDPADPLAPATPVASACRPVLIVGAIATFVRLVWVFLASREPTGLSDPIVYLSSGAKIAAGDGYVSLLGNPTAYYPPGYPAFLGAVERISTAVGLESHLVLVIGLVQALLGGVAAGALVVAGRQLAGSPSAPASDDTRAVGTRIGSTPTGSAGTRIGVVAGLVLAFWPNLVLHTPLVLSESLFLAVFCTLLASLFSWSTASVEGVSHRSTISVVVVSTALCTWIRPQSVVLLVPAIAAAWLICGLGWKRALKAAGLLVVGILVAVVPWTIRNLIVMDAFVPASTNTGDNLCIGFNDAATGGFNLGEGCATEQRYVDGADVEVQRDAELRERTVEWILDHPGRLPMLTVHKIGATFDHDYDALRGWESYESDPHLSDGARSALRSTSDIYYWVAGLLAIGGLAVVAKDRWSRRHRAATASSLAGMSTVAVALAGVLVPALTFGDQRFKIPVVPCMALLAALLLVHVADERRMERTEQP